MRNTIKKLSFQEGQQEGIKEGELKGKQQEKSEIAKKLLNKEIDISIISETTGLSIEEINKLKNQEN